MHKHLAIWTVFAVLGSFIIQPVIAHDYSSDQDLLVGGAIILHSQLKRPRWRDRNLPAFPATPDFVVFSEVEKEIGNMRNQLFVALQMDVVRTPFAMPISVE